jgi:Domain of unknown function (DUF5753)
VLASWAGATGAGLDELTKLAQQARSGFAGWTDDIEARASVIRWFEPSLIPGLIQTEACARAVLAWKPESASTEANLKNRLARQSVLDRAELRVVVLESVLSREVGDAATMGEQLEHLLTVGGRPTVTLQVLPDSPAVAGALGGAFAIASEGTPWVPSDVSRAGRLAGHLGVFVLVRACAVRVGQQPGQTECARLDGRFLAGALAANHRGDETPGLAGVRNNRVCADHGYHVTTTAGTARG